jgi:hypothetical protein
MALLIIIYGVICGYLHFLGIQLKAFKTILAVCRSTLFIELGHFLEKVGYRDGLVILKVSRAETIVRTIYRAGPIGGTFKIPSINAATPAYILIVTDCAIGASETRQTEFFNVVVAASATILAGKYV